MKIPRSHSRRAGFLLFEMVLALAVFGMAATGFVVALHRMAAAASLSQSELRITRILESALDETLSLPTLDQGITTSQAGTTGIELITDITILEEIQNRDGEFLQEMYRIEIKARWYENQEWRERMVETWRYGMMYQP
jgi:type II secretory pathway pseudopilin PulG